jgi:hypothetical protein
MPLVQVPTARRQPNVFGVVAEAAVAPAVVEEHQSLRHDDPPFFHQAFDGQVQGPREGGGTLAASVGRGGDGGGEEEEEDKEQGVGEEEEEAGTMDGEEVEHGDDGRRHSGLAPAAQE